MNARLNPRRTVLGAAGVTLLGGVLLAGDRVASALRVGDLVGLFGNDYLLVAALGGVSLLLAAVVAERGDTVVQSEMPDPEDGVSVPTPGDGLTATLDGWRIAVPLLSRGTRASVRDRLRESAVEAVVRTEGCTEREARERVASGRWTDDPDAAAFLARGRGPSLGAYRRALAGGDPWFTHGARRTADAVVALSGTTLRGDVVEGEEKEVGEGEGEGKAVEEGSSR